MIAAVKLWGGPRDGQTKELPMGIQFFPTLLPLNPEGIYLFHHFADEQTVVYRYCDFESQKREGEDWAKWEAEFEA